MNTIGHNDKKFYIETTIPGDWKVVNTYARIEKDTTTYDLCKVERFHLHVGKIIAAFLITLASLFFGLASKRVRDFFKGREVKLLAITFQENPNFPKDTTEKTDDAAKKSGIRPRSKSCEISKKPLSKDLQRKPVEPALVNGKIKEGKLEQNQTATSNADTLANSLVRSFVQTSPDTNNTDNEEWEDIDIGLWQNATKSILAASLSPEGSELKRLEGDLAQSLKLEEPAKDGWMATMINGAAKMCKTTFDSLKDMVVGETFSSTEDMVSTTLHYCATFAHWTAAYLSDGTKAATKQFYDLFIDGNDPWKQERYEQYNNQLLRFLESQNLTHAEELKKPLEDHIKLLKSGTCDHRLAYHHFRNEIVRKMVLTGSDNDRHLLEKICHSWFTAISALDNLKSTIVHLATQTNPEEYRKAKIEQNLATKAERILQVLDDVPQELLAPKASLNAAKALKLTSYFDPLSHMNMPWQYCEEVYQKEGTTKTVVNIRTGVPIGPKRTNAVCALDDVAIVPEYIGFLRALVRENKKILIVLHLNPSCIWQEGNKTATLASLNPLLMQEAKWARCVMQLADMEEFKNHVRVCLIPHDETAWTKTFALNDGNAMFSKDGGTILEFRKHLFSLIFGGFLSKDNNNHNLPFIIPQGLIDHDNVWELLKKVEKLHFPHKHKDNTAMTENDKRAFYGFFTTYLQEALQILWEADVVQKNCADGCDRTGDFIGCQAAIKMHALGTLDNNHDDFIAAVAGPAVAVCKRAMLKSRREFFPAVLKHLEEHPIPMDKKANFSFDGWHLTGYQLT